jgi:hypothetical protein
MRAKARGGGWVYKARCQGLVGSWTGLGHRWGSGVQGAASAAPRNTGYAVQVQRAGQLARPGRNPPPMPAVALDV